MASGKELSLALQNHLAICGGTGYRGPVTNSSHSAWKLAEVKETGKGSVFALVEN